MNENRYYKIEEAEKRFFQVRDTLYKKDKCSAAYRKAHYVPLRFYDEHSIEDAISILENGGEIKC